MAKKKEKPNNRSKRYPVGFQRDAVERMKHCTDVRKLAEELGVSRGALYLWKRRVAGLPPYRDAAKRGETASMNDPQTQRIRELEAKVAALEGELGRSSVEIRFFKGALRRIEEWRRQNEEPGGTASTSKSTAGKRKAH